MSLRHRPQLKELKRSYRRFFSNKNTEAAMNLSDCIEACTDCAIICRQAAIHCLSKGGDHATRDHIRLLWDCSDICQTSAAFMTRGSPHHTHTCKACAALCDICAKACGKMSDSIVQSCAETCRHYAELCHEMSSISAAA